MFIKGTNKHPIITKVYKFEALQQIDRESIAIEVTEYEQRGYDNANEIIEAYARHSIFGRYTIQDCMSYSQYKRQRSRTTGSKDSEERNIGATSLKTNSRTLADSSESAFSMPETRQFSLPDNFSELSKMFKDGQLTEEEFRAALDEKEDKDNNDCVSVSLQIIVDFIG